jgi:iron complex transport system substrate-binding protein
LAAGRDTAADGIIRLAGGVNSIDDFTGYKPLSDESVIGKQPDAILAMRRAGATLDAAQLFALPAFTLTPAARTGSFISMDGLYLLGFGPRTAQAAGDLAAALYPSLSPATQEYRKAGEACRS